ncbi:hypothetical protein ACQCSX_06715 [Pseudarthrobacter sp. P1]|uniref:hypothetical protein n=1 Tax=Pseudarthrobacter sp. P1 TaxID=3418418 RepID=UPI003CF0A1EC
MYAAAADIVGGAFVGKNAHAANELSGWTSPSLSTLDIPAHASLTNPITVAIPSDAAPGERYAVLWVETTGPGGGNVTLASRVGIRLYLAVNGDNPPAASFTVDTMTAERDTEGKPIVLAQVHNTGGRAVDISGVLTLAKVAGAVTAGPYDAVLGTTLAPGQSEPVRIMPTDDLVDGPWNATLDMQSGPTHAVVQAEISFPSNAGTAAPAATHEVQTTRTPWALIAVGAGVLLPATVILFVARRRTKAARAPVV